MEAEGNAGAGPAGAGGQGGAQGAAQGAGQGGGPAAPAVMAGNVPAADYELGVAGLGRFDAPNVAAHVVQNVNAVSAVSLNGHDDLADTAEVAGREYLTTDQKLGVPWPRAGETVLEYRTRMYDNRGRILARLAFVNYGRFACADTGMDEDKACKLAVACARLVLDTIGKCMPVYHGQTGYGDEDYEDGAGVINDADPAIDRFLAIFKQAEIFDERVFASADVAHPDMHRVVTVNGLIGRVVSQAMLTTIMTKLVAAEETKKLATAGRIALVIGKIMLFRTGHHVQTTTGHMDQISRAVTAAGVDAFMRAAGVTNDKSALAWYRVLVHPFRGWVARKMLDVFDGTATRAITIRMQGYGAGYARLNVFQAVAATCGRDHALNLLFELMTGRDTRKLAQVATGTFEIEGGEQIGKPDGATLFEAKYNMVHDAFEPGEGGPMHAQVDALLRGHATLIQASCEVIGGSLANQRTFAKDARSTRDLREIYDALKDASVHTITVSRIKAAALAAGGDDAIVSRIVAVLNRATGFVAYLNRELVQGDEYEE